jgi:hypothetical protein
MTYYNFAGASFQNVRAKFDFEATSDKQLSMKVGDVVVVLEKHASGWYKGELNGAIGMFPSNYTEVMAEVAPEDDATRTKVAELKAKRMARLQVRNSASPEVAASAIQRLVRSKSQKKAALEDGIVPAADGKPENAEMVSSHVQIEAAVTESNVESQVSSEIQVVIQARPTARFENGAQAQAASGDVSDIKRSDASGAFF